MQDDEKRDALYRAVHEEFIGPLDPLSEEVLRGTSPKQAYTCGVLYPKGSELDEVLGDELDADGTPIGGRGDGQDDEFEEPIALSNSKYQSAISVTIAVASGDSIGVDVRAGRYSGMRDEDGKPRYERRPVAWHTDALPLPSPATPVPPVDIEGTSLQVIVVYRYPIGTEGFVVTVALCNGETAQDPRSCGVGSCYFQCQLSLASSLGFLPIPSDLDKSTYPATEDERANRLLYSKVRNFAMGHGCAADWSDETSPDGSPRPRRIETKTMPVAEVRSATPIIEGLDPWLFDMRVFGDPARWEETSSAIEELCSAYEGWIEGIRREAADVDPRLAETADDNVRDCERCLGRMRRGLQILGDDGRARRAFQLMNQAMLSQHLHYSVVSGEREDIREPAEHQRAWRPFQIAFILTNIESMTVESSDERGLVDLIWFPTGGGKTEAYLGLTAYTLILERLNGEECHGSTVLMRYTLRLLTSQQFSRAASLICALEDMRRRDPATLGTKRFTIGLWVGKNSSPNTWSSAMTTYDTLRRDYEPAAEQSPIPITQCPWCGAPMGGKGAAGFKKTRDRTGKRDGGLYLRFVCPNHDCGFSDDEGLPLEVVDEEVYIEPPSLLLGTVDKFAMIPYRPGAYRIFGIDERGRHVHAPKLIIQDELHLISGPLGSMVANYETLVDELCTTREGGTERHPKVIASTATVSRAKEQCNEIFACGRDSVVQFPPSGLSYDDSFFSRIDHSARGRRYVGVYVPNSPSAATTNIKLYASLLWEPATWELEDEAERDPYYTVIGYYGTTRELGQALTWASSDIPERLKEHHRKDPAHKRYLNEGEVIELTGRKDAAEVRQGLDRLARHSTEEGAVSLCLATNMISVGLDVQRLGVMVMAGQPKETSEYIQASSRVGRGDAKGMVFVAYGITKPRDRSHYESFRNYHESFYQHVEPSSATAFCEQVRRRAMPGVLIGLYRSKHLEDAGAPGCPDDDEARELCKTVLDRVRRVDPPEAEATREQLEEILGHWGSQNFERWEELSPEPKEAVPLMHPYGGKELAAWGDSGTSFAVPTSMRSVDVECKVRIKGSSWSGDGE